MVRLNCTSRMFAGLWYLIRELHDEKDLDLVSTSQRVTPYATLSR